MKPILAIAAVLALVAVFALATREGNAAAPAATSGFLAQPAFADFKPAGTDRYTAPGATLTAKLRGSSVFQAAAEFDNVNDPRAGVVLAALLGQGANLEAPLAQFIRQNDAQLRLPGGITVQDFNPYRVNVQILNNRLALDVRVVEVSAENFITSDLVLGDRDASVVIRVYSDFECPYCEKLEKEMFHEFGQNPPAGVRIEFHHFPLESIHPHARSAHEASECAAEQGQFWAFHDALFDDRSWLQGPAPVPGPVFASLATRLKLNVSEFSACLSAGRGKAKVDAGIQGAMKLGVTGTPTMYVNGFKVANPYDRAALDRMIALARD